MTELPEDDPRSMTSQMNIDTSSWAVDLAARYKETREGVQNGVGMWRSDVGAIILDYFQMYAMLLLLAAQSGAYPQSLFRKTYFTLWANLAFWGGFEHADYDVDEAQPRASSVVTDSGAGLSYYVYIGVWTGMPVVLLLCCLLAEWAFKVDDELKWKRRTVKIRHIAFWCAQAIIMPLGITYGRSFQCTNSVNQSFGDTRTWQSVVDNDEQCFTGSLHRLTIALSAGFGLTYAALVSVFYARKVALRVYLHQPAHHEVFLRFKEAEYVANTDHGWADGMFWLFSSYQRTWVNYKVYNVVYKVVVIAGFAFGKRYEQTQAGLICGAMFVHFIMTCTQIYRVRACNAIATILGSANVLNALFVVTNVFRANSMYRDALGPAVAAYNGLALFLTFCLLVYCELRSRGFVAGRPVWPMVYDPNSHADEGLRMPEKLHTTAEEQLRYAEQLRLLVAGRNVLAACHRAPAVLQPMHDVLRCLLIANAMARETTPDSDALHYALWDMVDELSDAYNENDGRSIFSLAQKSSTAETARELSAILPEFSKRLAVRDFDFALVRPEMKSILLKLQVIAAFMGKRKAFPFNPKIQTKPRAPSVYSIATPLAEEV